ncbi:MAG: hypothetical protein RSD13_05115 [Clostridium sp.]
MNCVKNTLFSVKKTIALLVTIVFCYLSIIGKISSSEFIPVFSMIVGYYFGKSTALEVPNYTHKGNTDISDIEYK